MSLDPRTQAVMRMAKRVAELLEQAGVGPDDPDYFEILANETDVDAAIARLARLALGYEAEAKGVKDYIDALKARAERKTRAADRLREEIFFAMTELGIAKVPAPDVTIYLQKGRPKLVGDADPDNLPDALVRIKREIDRAKIKDAIESGAEVEGFAISNSAPNLVLRVS